MKSDQLNLGLLQMDQRMAKDRSAWKFC